MSARTGKNTAPVMLHRAMLGSLERFIGILIEEYAGKFPLWLAPVQAVVCPLTNEFDGYATEVVRALTHAGIRVALDSSNNTINYKVREHSLQKIPCIFVVGKREAEQRSVALRRLGSEKQEILALDAAITTLVKECAAPDLAGAA